VDKLAKIWRLELKKFKNPKELIDIHRMYLKFRNMGVWGIWECQCLITKDVWGGWFFAKSEPRRVVRTKEIFYILKNGSMGSGVQNKFGGEFMHIEFCH
jgi:hypothetical protein